MKTLLRVFFFVGLWIFSVGFLDYSGNPVLALGICPADFTRDLRLNSSGSDIRELQKYLNDNGFPLAKTGSGSKGSETDFFGVLTEAALSRFQKANFGTILDPIKTEEEAGNLYADTRDIINNPPSLYIYYILNYAAGPGGTITGISSQKVKSGGSGTSVTAAPNSGYYFVDWSDGSTKNPRIDNNIAADKSVTANFVFTTYSLTYTAGDNGSITGETSQTVRSGGSGTAVTAVPNAGYYFVDWSDSSSANPRTDTDVTADKSVTANFAYHQHSHAATYYLNYTAGDNGSITGETSQTVRSGGSGTAVTAVPNAGCYFVDWSDGISTDNRTDADLTTDISVTANFAITQTVVDLSNLVFSGSPANYAFAGSTYTYNGVTVLNAVSGITVTPTGSGTITVEGTPVTSDEASGSIALTAGVEKTITIIAAETGKSNKTYTVKVTRNAGVQAAPTFDPAAGAIAFGTAVAIASSGADAIYYTTNGTDPTTGSTPYSTPVSIDEALTLKAIAIKAGYDDSAIGSAAYTQAATANLSGLVLSGSPANYTFAGSTYTYNGVTVLNAVSSVTVTPTGSGTITVEGTPVTSGEASGSIALTAGVEKTITIIATETGKSSKTYTIKVTRALIIISLSAVPGVTVPVTGATPVTTITATAQYTGTVTWSGSPSTFASATAYTATITLTPTAGYTLTGVAENLFTVAGTTSDTNPANSGVVTAAFPATATTISTAAILGVTVPVTGATPVTTITAATQYTGTVTWSGSPSTFASATVYTATITLTPTAGYTLTGVAENLFTVAGTTSDTNPANSGVVTAAFPATATTISTAAILGVTVPVSLATPVTTITAAAQYTGTVTWAPADNPFACATVYTATITLTPTAGYTLTGVAANLFTVAGATSDTNPANSGVVTAAFPATSLIVGCSYQGGKIGYIFVAGNAGYVAGEIHGLIVAPDQGHGTVGWGCWPTWLVGARGIAIGTGNQNTIDIMNGCATAGIPARICGDLVLGGYSDWYLPSTEEGHMICHNGAAIGLTSTDYWQSTQSTTGGGSAMVRSWNTGACTTGLVDKQITYVHVVPVRNF